MKVKTALRFYLTPIRVTIIKKLNDKMHARLLERGTFIHRWTLIDFVPRNIALLWQVIASLFTTVRKAKQLRSSSANEWIRNVWYIHTLKSYLTAKKSRITKFSVQWMKMESLYWKRQSRHRKQLPQCFALCRS